MSTQEKEYTTLDEFKYIPKDDIAVVCAEGINTSTGYVYDYRFSFRHDAGGQSISIGTEERQEFLKKGTENQAQTALINLAQHTRKLSGGIFDIHAFDGAVQGTKLTLVAPAYGASYPSLHSSLSMIVNLDRSGTQYNYNKEHRIIAEINDLEESWDEEYAKYNHFTRFGKLYAPNGIELNPKSISKLLRALGRQGLMAGIAVTSIQKNLNYS